MEISVRLKLPKLLFSSFSIDQIESLTFLGKIKKCRNLDEFGPKWHISPSVPVWHITMKMNFYYTVGIQKQCRSEIHTPDFEWSKRGWVANGPELEWDLKSRAHTFEIGTNGCHFGKNHLKSWQKRLDFEWLGLEPWLKPDPQKVRILNGWILDPRLNGLDYIQILIFCLVIEYSVFRRPFENRIEKSKIASQASLIQFSHGWTI